MEQVALTPPSHEPIKPEVTPEPGIGSQYKEFRPLYDHFNIRVEGARHDKALSLIWDWAKAQASGKDKDSIVFEVIKLNHKMGSPNLGMRPYAKLENYVTVWNRLQRTEQQVKELEGLAQKDK